jgi:hypothetical protein
LKKGIHEHIFQGRENLILKDTLRKAAEKGIGFDVRKRGDAGADNLIVVLLVVGLELQEAAVAEKGVDVDLQDPFFDLSDGTIPIPGIFIAQLQDILSDVSPRLF